MKHGLNCRALVPIFEEEEPALDAINYFASRRRELTETLKTLAGFESPTGDKRAVDACSEHIVSLFQTFGASILRHPRSQTGDLYTMDLFFEREKDKRAPLLILLHSDTVWPVGRISSMPIREQGERLSGPGVLDMKAGIVMALAAVKAFRDTENTTVRPLRLFLNSCEETGSPDIEPLLRDLAGNAAAILCLEPSLPGGALKMRRKGRIVGRLVCRGLSAHAGHPEKGVSAVDELSRQLRRLHRIRRGGTTVNPGVIAGGQAVNVVAEEAWAQLDIRFWTAFEEDRVTDYFQNLEAALPGARVAFHLESRIPPMAFSPASRRLFFRAVKIAQAMGLKLHRGKSGGGSDASQIADCGVPILDGLGPDGDGIHAPHEFVLIPSLIDRTALLFELLKRI